MSRCETPASQSLLGLSRAELLKHFETARQRAREAESQCAAKDDEIRALRSQSVEAQLHAEVEEERVSNTLLKRMDNMKRSNTVVEQSIRSGEDKNRAILAEIATIRRNKVEVENRIEAEQERMLHTLHGQLLSVASEKAKLERVLQGSREDVLARLHVEVERLRSRCATPQPPGAGTDASTGASPASSTPVSPANRQGAGLGGSVSSLSSTSRTGTIARLEEQLARLIDDARDAQKQLDAADKHHEELASDLRRVQDESFLAKAKVAKLRADLDRAQAELTTERASNAATPVLPSSSTDATPLHASTAALASVGGSSSLVRRASHNRTHSGSSVESWSSASVASTPMNIGLARQDPEVVRQHTARVLSSAPASYPSPRRSSSRASGRSSAVPQPPASN